MIQSSFTEFKGFSENVCKELLYFLLTKHMLGVEPRRQKWEAHLAVTGGFSRWFLAGESRSNLTWASFTLSSSSWEATHCELHPGTLSKIYMVAPKNRSAAGTVLGGGAGRLTGTRRAEGPSDQRLGPLGRQQLTFTYFPAVPIPYPVRAVTHQMTWWWLPNAIGNQNHLAMRCPRARWRLLLFTSPGDLKTPPLPPAFILGHVDHPPPESSEDGPGHYYSFFSRLPDPAAMEAPS